MNHIKISSEDQLNKNTAHITETTIKTGIIYRVTSPTKKTYIGQSIHNLEKRKRGHLSQSKNKKSDYYKTKIAKAIRKYDNQLVWETIHENVPVDNLDNLETQEIINHNSFYEGYNGNFGGNDGGFRGKKHKDKAKRILSEKRKGENNPMFGKSGDKNPFFGKKHSEETKKKMKDKKPDFSGKNNPMYGKTSAMKGKKHSEETKLKISKSKIGSKNPFFGKKHSEEAKKKMKEARDKVKQPRERNKNGTYK